MKYHGCHWSNLRNEFNILKLLQIFRRKLALWVFLSVRTFTSKNLSPVISVPFQVKWSCRYKVWQNFIVIHRFNLAFTYYGIVLMTTEMYQGLSESEGSCGGTNETTCWYLSLNKPFSLLIQNIFFHLTDNLMSNKH